MITVYSLSDQFRIAEHYTQNAYMCKFSFLLY